MQLEGKAALVTGAGRGIGREIALTFAKEGCDVAVASRTRTEVEAVAEEIRGLGRRSLAVVCDVTDYAGVSTMVEHVIQEFGGVDILVNNAGYARFQPFKDLPPEEWRRTLDVNLTGPYYCTKAVLPSMIARQSGRIINISSNAGVKPIRDQSAYCASKHGLNGLSKVLAMELRPYGINVHAICPGGVDTQLSRQAMPHRDHSEFMAPEDIAHTALYLATLSPRATVDEIVVRRFASVPVGG